MVMDPPLLTIRTSLKSKQKSPPLPTINYFQLCTVKSNAGKPTIWGGGVLLYKIFGADSIPIFMSVTGYWFTCGGGGGGGGSSSSNLSTSETSHIKYYIPQTIRITTITLPYFFEFLRSFSQIFRA